MFNGGGATNFGFFYKKPQNNFRDPSPIDYKLVASKTRILQSTIVDVRPRRTVHVTDRCGRCCGATHCALSSELPPAPRVLTEKPPTIDDGSLFVAKRRRDSLQSALNVLDDLINETLAAPDDMEGRSSHQWKSSFQNTRQMFKNDRAFGRADLRLGGMKTNSNSVEIFLENNKLDISDLESLNGNSDSSRGRGSSSTKSSVVRSRSAHSMESMFLTNGNDEPASLFDRRTSVDDVFRKSKSRSKSPLDSLSSASSQMSDFWNKAVSQPRYDFFNKSSINAAATKSEGSSSRIKIFDENSRFDKLFESFVSKQPPPSEKRPKLKQENQNFKRNDETSFLELDSIIEDMKATGKRLEASEITDNSTVDSSALKIINKVQSILQTNIDSLSSTKFPEMSTSPERRKSSSSPDCEIITHYSSQHHHYHSRGRHHNAIREMFQINEKFPKSNIWRSLATGSVAERVQQFDRTSPDKVTKPATPPAVLDSLREALAEACGQVKQ